MECEKVGVPQSAPNKLFYCLLNKRTEWMIPALSLKTITGVFLKARPIKMEVSESFLAAEKVGCRRDRFQRTVTQRVSAMDHAPRGQFPS